MTTDSEQWQAGDIFYLIDYSESFIRDHKGLLLRDKNIEKGSIGIFLQTRQNPSYGMKFLTYNWAKVLVKEKICYIPFRYMSKVSNE